MPNSTLVSALVFDLNGTLLTSQGQVPTFLRPSPANIESTLNGSWRLSGVTVHNPRFTTSGSLVLERDSINLITYPQDLTHSSWIKGSSMIIQADRIQGMDSNYLADRIAISQTTGNQAAQTLSKVISLASGQPLTLSAYLRLAGGRFGANDVLRITGDVAAAQSIPLGPIFNDKPGNYIPVVLNAASAGTAVTGAAYLTPDTARNVTIALYCENSVSIDWGGIQLEPGTIRTSYIGQDAQVRSRAADYLAYPKSPIEGLAAFCCYLNLEKWAGDGNLVDLGNFKIEIVGGKLRASCGAVQITDPDSLPASAKIAVRVSQGLARAQIYVNGIMKAKASISNYLGQSSVVAIAGAGVRQIKCLYFFNRDIGDGSIDVGGFVLGDMLSLHQQDSLISDLAEGNSRIVFPPIRLPAGGSASIRFPQYQSANQAITVLTTGSGSVAQVDRVTVNAIANASAAQTDSILINGTQYSFTSDATPTVAEIALGLVAAVNANPRTQPVTATYTSGGVFTLTADAPGIDFSLSVSSRLSQANITANILDTHTLTVANASDFVVGKAQIFRNYTFLTDVVIRAINTGTNILTVSTFPNSAFAGLRVGDNIMQPSWSLNVGPNNYFAHHLEDYGDVGIASKTQEGFTLFNRGTVDRAITPEAKIVL
jgi:hypothetical protein